MVLRSVWKGSRSAYTSFAAPFWNKTNFAELFERLHEVIHLVSRFVWCESNIFLVV